MARGSAAGWARERGLLNWWGAGHSDCVQTGWKVATGTGSQALQLVGRLNGNQSFIHRCRKTFGIGERGQNDNNYTALVGKGHAPRENVHDYS